MKKCILLLLCVCLLICGCASSDEIITTEGTADTVNTSSTARTYETLHQTISRTTAATQNTDNGETFSDEEYERFMRETWSRTTWNIEIIVSDVERIYDEKYGHGIKFDLEMFDYDNLGFYRYKSFGLEYLKDGEWVAVNKMLYTDEYSFAFCVPKKKGYAYGAFPENYYYSGEKELPAGTYRISKLFNQKMLIFAEFELK